MNELRFWTAHVKPALNSGPHRVAWKVGTSTRAGIPDVAYLGPDGMAWIELKRLQAAPARPSTPLRLGLSVEQQAHLRDWCQNGGTAFVIAAIGDRVVAFPWYVSDVIQPENFREWTLLDLPLKDCKTLLGPKLDEILYQGEKEPAAREAVWFAVP